MEQVPETTLLRNIKYLIEAESFEAEEVRAAVKKILGIPENIVEQSEMDPDLEHAASKIQHSSDESTDDASASEQTSQLISQTLILKEPCPFNMWQAHWESLSRKS